MCDCQQRLLDAAADLLKDADRAKGDPRLDRNRTYITARATGYAAAAGLLSQRKLDVTDTLTTVTPEIERDRYGRPMIVPPTGGKKIAYRRTTSYVSVLEDTFNLSRWSQRMVAVGLADRPDLLLGVAAHRDDKDKLNQLCADAAEAAKAHAAATTGTALHALTEIVDRGLELPILPESARVDIEAYRKATAGIEWLAIEQGIVVDELQVHGTPDRIGRLPDGRVVILDVKTGSVDYGMGKIACQLAMYAHGLPYDHVTGKRAVDRVWTVDQEVGVVIHLPAGTGTCDLLEVDLAAGWDGVQVCRQVWEWRSRKNLARPYQPPAFDLAGLISLAATEADLMTLWSDYRDQWTDAATEAARARKLALAGAA